MKSIVIILAFFFCAGFAYAQDAEKKKDPKKSELYGIEKRVYNQAKRYNDYPMAMNALYRLVAIDPDDVSLLDSLAFLYYEFQQHASVILVTRDILRRQPNNLAAMELSAVSFEALGVKDRALDAYESLYLKTDDPGTLYKMAYLQLDLERLRQAESSAKSLTESKRAKERFLRFNNEDSSQAQVRMDAAAYYLLGMVKDKQGEKAEAKKHMEKALEISPEFQQAKNSLASL